MTLLFTGDGEGCIMGRPYGEPAPLPGFVMPPAFELGYPYAFGGWGCPGGR